MNSLQIAYNNAQHSGLGCSPWFVEKGYNPRVDFLVGPSTSKGTVDIAKHLSHLKEVQSQVINILVHAQTEQKKYADRKRIPNPFTVGQKVYLSAKNIKTKRPKKKLDNLWLGPYEIISKIGNEAWKLKLGVGMEKLHPIFHSSLLEVFHENKIPGRIIPPPPPVEIDDVYEYEVDKIVDSRIIRNQLQYRIKWKHYGVEHDSWEPDINIANAIDLIKEFHDTYPNKPTIKDIRPKRKIRKKN